MVVVAVIVVVVVVVVVVAVVVVVLEVQRAHNLGHRSAKACRPAGSFVNTCLPSVMLYLMVDWSLHVLATPNASIRLRQML